MNSCKQKELCFGKIPDANANAKCQLNAKNLHIFLQEGVQLKCSIDKSTILLDFFATFCNKTYY